ncbi:MAG: ArsR/SmtB family transcription factor [Campylobacterales bacterium]
MLSTEEKVNIFKALGNETRFEIFQNVLNTPYECDINTQTKSKDIIKQATCVGTIASEFNYSLPTISRHLKELKNAKLIIMEKVANKIYVKPNLQIIDALAECFCHMRSKKHL